MISSPVETVASSGAASAAAAAAALEVAGPDAAVPCAGEIARSAGACAGACPPERSRAVLGLSSKSFVGACAARGNSEVCGGSQNGVRNEGGKRRVSVGVVG